MVDFGDIPIIVEGRSVGQVIIQPDRESAIRLATAAATHISTPNDIQFCSFSDASSSQGPEYRGGVGLVYKWRWLPQGWVAGRAATDPAEDMVEKAWPYGYAVGTLVVEGVGILESLHAANEEIKRHRSVLAKHASTVKVKVTTDCQAILHHICRTTPTADKTKKRLPPQLIKNVKDLILSLQDHKIEVAVELHWCPRNMVPQLMRADELAGEARRSGMSYCNATGDFWSEATESVIMKKLEPMLSGTVRFAHLPMNHISTGAESAGAGPTGTTEKETRKKTRRGKKETRRAKAAAELQPSAAKSHPQLPLPAGPLPSKPLSSKPLSSKPLSSKPLPPKPATTSNAKPTTTSADPTTTPTTTTTTTPSTKPMSSAAADVQLPEKPIKVETVKRKAEDVMEEREGMPNKKSKLSPDRKRQEQQQQSLTMPAACALDPYLSDPEEGEITEKPLPVAKPIGIVLQD